jgi:uncharacterized protein YcaQ
LDRALRSQGIISLNSVCYLDARSKPAVRQLIDRRVAGGRLESVEVEGIDDVEFWASPNVVASAPRTLSPMVHILSPFDPLIIQRKRLKQFFDYEHRFEAYVPKNKRTLGYFTMPVLVGDKILAAIDLKADRQKRELAIQSWVWTGGTPERHKALIEEALHRFENFQLDN